MDRRTFCVCRHGARAAVARVRAFAAVLLLLPVQALAQGAVPGAELGELLDLVRRFNPEIAARVLESDAAAARIVAAGSLPDPTFSASFEDIDRRRGSLAPKRLGAIFYSVEQEFPLWGKRELRRGVARAEADAARGRARATAAELAARVRVAFAKHYQADQSVRITKDIHDLLHTISSAAQARYAQGIASQTDAIRAELEKTRLQQELAMREQEKSAARARLNALLNRPPGSPLADPRALPPVPPPEFASLDELVFRAGASNPMLVAGRAEIAAAQGNKELADKAWYPDVALSGTIVDRDRNITGYEAMVAFKIPLQWSLREAEQREAVAKLGAAGARLQAEALKIQGELEEAWRGLETTRQVEALLRSGLQPQTDAGYRSALASYQVGRADLTAVLEIARGVQQVRIDLLKVQTEQQTLLAEIERLVGEEL